MDLQDFASALHQLIGDDDGPIAWWQMALRAVVIFIFGILLVRLAGKAPSARPAPSPSSSARTSAGR